MKRIDQPSRNPVIEVLRMLTMFLIILGHILVHGNMMGIYPHGHPLYYLLQGLFVLSTPATNVFILLSAYFMCTSKFRIKRVVLFWVQVFFFNLAAHLVVFAAGAEPFTLGSLPNILLPISTNRYWYMRVFLGMMLLSPFLNLMIGAMTEKQHRGCVLVFTVLFSLWRNILPITVTLNPEGGNGLLWFLTLYLIAAYIRKYVDVTGKTAKLALASLGLFGFSVAATLAVQALSLALGFQGKGSSLFTEDTSINILLLSVSTFLLFLSLRNPFTPKASARINQMAASVLSIYCIHDHPLLRRWFWNEPLIDWMSSDAFWMLPRMLLSALGAYVLCTVIDKLTFARIQKLLKRISFSGLQQRLDPYLSDPSASVKN